MSARGMMQTTGWIGIGNIGLPMMRQVARAGHRIAVCDKDPARVALAVSAGISAAISPAEVARQSDVIFLNLPDGNAVSEVMFGATGLAAQDVRGKLVIDTSSIDPLLTRELAARLASLGGRPVDAPVSGGVRAAEEARLVAFVGGADQDAAAAHPWIGCFAHRQTHLGPSGSGQWAKLVNQTIVCGTIALWSDAMILARAGGLDSMAVVEALAGSSADSRVRMAFAPQIATGAFKPSPNLVKDVATALTRIDDAGADSALLQAVARTFNSSGT